MVGEDDWVGWLERMDGEEKGSRLRRGGGRFVEGERDLMPSWGWVMRFNPSYLNLLTKIYSF